PHQPHVREQLQTQLDLPRLALDPALGEARRLPGRGGEALVAMSPRPATGDDQALAVLHQLGDRSIEAPPHRPRRNHHHEVLTSLSVLALAPAVLPAAGAEMAAPSERGEVPALWVADERDVAAPAAVAAVGPAAGYVGLAPEADHAVAAAAALHVD